MNARAISTLVLVHLVLAGCVRYEGSSHSCPVWSPALHYLFDDGYDVDLGERTLSELGFNLSSEPLAGFEGWRGALFAQGVPSNTTGTQGPQDDWTLLVYLTKSWPTRPSGQQAASDHARAELKREADEFVPAFENAYGKNHHRAHETESPMGCD